MAGFTDRLVRARELVGETRQDWPVSPTGSRYTSGYLRAMARYRLIDTASSELGFAELDPADVAEDVPITLPDGSTPTVLEIYDADADPEETEDIAGTLVLDID